MQSTDTFIHILNPKDPTCVWSYPQMSLGVVKDQLRPDRKTPQIPPDQTGFLLQLLGGANWG